MAATSVVKFTNLFEDATEYTMTVGTFDPMSLDSEVIKENVMAVNAGMGKEGTQYENYPNYLVSENGTKWTRINRVQIVTTERTYLF